QFERRAKAHLVTRNPEPLGCLRGRPSDEFRQIFRSYILAQKQLNGDLRGRALAGRKPIQHGIRTPVGNVVRHELPQPWLRAFLGARRALCDLFSPGVSRAPAPRWECPYCPAADPCRPDAHTTAEWPIP